MPHQAAYLAARRGPACVRNVCIHVCGLRTFFDGIRSSPLLFSIRKVIIIDASHIRRNALVVQWIGQRFPVPPMQVRFLSEAPDTKSLFPNVRTSPRIASDPAELRGKQAFLLHWVAPAVHESNYSHSPPNRGSVQSKSLI